MIKMDKPEFAIADVPPGRLNALVKNIMAQMGIDDPGEAVRRVNSGEWVVRIAGLLKPVATVQVSSTPKFIASEHVQTANVGWMGDNFRRVFLNFVEENMSDATLAVSRIERNSLDAPILTELGDKAETKLAYLFQLMEKQSRGEEGMLLVNGYANIVYVEDEDNTVWAVHAHWYSDYGCWYVDAYSVGDPSEWGAGYQVLSRDS